ncbi:hypothetical protein EBU99_09580 [bacterium]|nr:hypothetical protein [bacterium]
MHLGRCPSCGATKCSLLSKIKRPAKVFSELLRAGVGEKLGLHFAQRKSINSKIIFCSVNDFGESAPNKDCTRICEFQSLCSQGHPPAGREGVDCDSKITAGGLKLFTPGSESIKRVSSVCPSANTCRTTNCRNPQSPFTRVETT